jgi:hypothetical protein
MTIRERNLREARDLYNFLIKKGVSGEEIFMSIMENGFNNSEEALDMIKSCKDEFLGEEEENDNHNYVPRWEY